MRVNIKKGTPVIRAFDVNKILVGKEDGNKLSPRAYINSFSKHELVVHHGEAISDEGEIFTLTSGGAIDSVSMEASGNVIGDGPKSHGELSAQRLNSNREIVGSPSVFELIQVKEEDIESTDYIAHGYSKAGLIQ